MGQDEVAHLLDGQFQFLGLLPQLCVPVLESVELLLLHGRGHPSFGPAAATGHVVEVPGPAVAGLSRVALRGEVVVGRWRSSAATLSENESNGML